MLDKDFETRVLACLYRSTEFCSVGVEYLKPKYFTSNMANNLAKLAMDFYRKYKTPITQQGFVDGLNYLVGKQLILEGEKREYVDAYVSLAKTDVTDYKYTLDKLLDFVKKSEWRIFAVDLVEDLLPNGKFDEIEKRSNEISSINSAVSIDIVSYKDTIEERAQRRKEDLLGGVKGIPTGIEKLDEALGHRGWCPCELYAFGGPPKTGKSMALLWCANYASIIGNNVAYFTLEVSREVIEDRNDAMNADIAINSLGHYTDEVVNKLKSLEMKGNLDIIDLPTNTLSIGNVERILKTAEIQNGKRYDMIIIDQLKLMKIPKDKDEWLAQERLAVELRRVAKEWNIPILTALHINRGGSNKAVVTGTDVAGAYSVIGVLDGFLTLGGKRDIMDRGELILRLSEFRNAPSRMIRIKTDYGCGKFYKEYLGEEYE